MLKKRLEELIVPELKLIAKKIGIKGYSTVKKKELIELILTVQEDKILSALELLKNNDNSHQKKDKVELPKEKSKVNWFKVLQIGIPMLIFLVGLLTYLRGCKKNELDICDVSEIKAFDDTDAFNVLILDFLDYTFCNAYAECEVEFQKRIDKINEYSHVPINSKVTSCRSKDLNILNLDDAEEFCKLKNADLVIFGAVENISNDSIRVNLSYVTHPNVSPTIIDKTKNEKNFVINSIFDISDSNHDFKEIEDIINWNLAIKVHGTTDPKKYFTLVRLYLNKISNYNYKNYSNAKLIEGTTYLKFENDYNEAIKHLNTSVKIDSLNWNAYEALSFANMLLGNEEETVRNMQYSAYTRLYICDPPFTNMFNDEYAVHSLLDTLDNLKKYDVGYSFLIHTLLAKEEYTLFIPKYFAKWERECGRDYVEEELGENFEYVKLMYEMKKLSDDVLDSIPKVTGLMFELPTLEEFNKHMKRVSSTTK